MAEMLKAQDGRWDQFKQNMKLLYTTFPLVRCVDIDCEETSDDWVNTCITFAKMCNDIGFDVSIAPFSNFGDWKTILASGAKFSHINLQGYSVESLVPTQAESFVTAFTSTIKPKIPIIYGFSSDFELSPFTNVTNVTRAIKNQIAGCFVWQYNNTDINNWTDAVKKG